MKTLTLLLQEPQDDGEFLQFRIKVELPESNIDGSFLFALYEKILKDYKKYLWNKEISLK